MAGGTAYAERSKVVASGIELAKSFDVTKCLKSDSYVESSRH